MTRLTEKAEKELREYFTSAPFPLLERAALITKTFEIIPFKNFSETPAHTISQGSEDLDKMADLISKDNLFGWAHSHPHWDYFPSSIDILNHNLFIHVIIYSGILDSFFVWEPEQMLKFKEDMQNCTASRKILTQ